MVQSCPSSRFARFGHYVLQPLTLYLLAAACWAWASGEAGSGRHSLGAFAGVLLLSIHWSFLSPCAQGYSTRYRVWTCLVPLVLGSLGIAGLYLRAP